MKNHSSIRGKIYGLRIYSHGDDIPPTYLHRRIWTGAIDVITTRYYNLNHPASYSPAPRLCHLYNRISNLRIYIHCLYHISSFFPACKAFCPPENSRYLVSAAEVIPQKFVFYPCEFFSSIFCDSYLHLIR